MGNIDTQLIENINNNSIQSPIEVYTRQSERQHIIGKLVQLLESETLDDDEYDELLGDFITDCQAMELTKSS